MTRERAIELLTDLLNRLNTQHGFATKSELGEVVAIYIADLQADDRNNGANDD